ncbi:MAG: c-type cytochrome [Pseudomonadota bacterium]
MKTAPLASIPFLAFALTQLQTAGAQTFQSGEQVYKQTCVACHGSGVANAPKFGDRKAWKPLIAEGQPVLTAHAWVGVRGMPPKGGRADLSLEEFAGAVAFMSREAGGKWQEPDARMMEKIRHEEKRRHDSLKHRK